jgi:hypothetical protein
MLSAGVVLREKFSKPQRSAAEGMARRESPYFPEDQ